MKYKKHYNFTTPFILLTFFIILFFGCNHKDSEIGNNIETHKKNNETEQVIKSEIFDEIAVESPPFTDVIFPCNDCHADMESNATRRELVDMHDDITAIFDHDSENRWCLDCHDLNSRDSLKLASGKLLDFKESYKLCGQCHGDKLRDWKVGIHGKRTGEWNGKKQYLLCVHCHNPHSPKFESMVPLPPPVRQKDLY